jgi:ElaB/YqjD/DUF883 family membrane-anchored ribosome-binding protein
MNKDLNQFSEWFNFKERKVMEATKIKKDCDHEVSSMDEALSFLNGAASESSDKIQRMIEADYNNVKNVLKGNGFISEKTSINPEMPNANLEVNARQRAMQASRETAMGINNAAHRYPWAFIGASTVLSAALGVYIGRRINNK